MSSVLTTLRTHWKKSVFFTVGAGYGASLANKARLERRLMADYCREAAEFGRAEQPIQRPMYNVTVILNPAAAKGTARKKYEKYCAPILHLAGVKVSVVRTESEGEAKDIMAILKDADAVLVAGGDGTLMEAVTGFVRRPDSKRLSGLLPIGVLPVGQTNRLSRSLFPAAAASDRAESEAEMMAGAAMACVKKLYRPVDLMQVENVSEDEELKGKKIYALSEMQIGAFRFFKCDVKLDLPLQDVYLLQRCAFPNGTLLVPTGPEEGRRLRLWVHDVGEAPAVERRREARTRRRCSCTRRRGQRGARFLVPMVFPRMGSECRLGRS